jgi:hypothetical protein
LANEVVNLIALQKIQLISLGEFKKIADTAGRIVVFIDEHGIPLHKDNQDYGTQFYMVDSGGVNSETLVNAINRFKNAIIELLEDDGDDSNDYLVERYKRF